MIALRPRLRFAVLAAAFVAQFTVAGAQEVAWEPYRHPDYSYQIDLPLGLFENLGEIEGKVLLEEQEGSARLSVYGEDNPDGLAIEDIAKSLESSEWIREVTYRKGGSSWFVMSGFYQQDGEQSDEHIFYLKLMMKPDRSRYAVFAISYPLDDKARFDPVVERLEASFRPPQ